MIKLWGLGRKNNLNTHTQWKKSLKSIKTNKQKETKTHVAAVNQVWISTVLNCVSVTFFFPTIKFLESLSWNLPGLCGQTSVLTYLQNALCLVLGAVKVTLLSHGILAPVISHQGILTKTQSFRTIKGLMWYPIRTTSTQARLQN